MDPDRTSMLDSTGVTPIVIKREGSPDGFLMRDGTPSAKTPAHTTIWVSSITVPGTSVHINRVPNCSVPASQDKANNYRHKVPAHLRGSGPNTHYISLATLRSLMHDMSGEGWFNSGKIRFVMIEWHLNGQSQPPAFKTRHMVVADADVDGGMISFAQGLDWAWKLVEHVNGFNRVQEEAAIAAAKQELEDAAERKRQRLVHMQNACCALMKGRLWCRDDEALAKSPCGRSAMNNNNNTNNGNYNVHTFAQRRRQQQAALRRRGGVARRCGGGGDGWHERQDEKERRAMAYSQQLVEWFRGQAEEEFEATGDTSKLLQARSMSQMVATLESRQQQRGGRRANGTAAAAASASSPRGAVSNGTWRARMS
ncbi:hypothetical protein B0T26DRAFT_678890 [Lasiosphaeria miniovina]|uniref:Uncharacterized protein n=1 Tax=Lasiosphaeria miniovina TaxID=1954250 RepID=A0AA40A526_9PEZI|nr:uncharacterized protein B0T26DRAFT_678890 [Lasiosphaeria miniovina]KAK0709478.1 hypothetical protein B0T26DRAFT_678890 [Lasiosphaeria miniovina]